MTPSSVGRQLGKLADLGFDDLVRQAAVGRRTQGVRVPVAAAGRGLTAQLGCVSEAERVVDGRTGSHVRREDLHLGHRPAPRGADRTALAAAVVVEVRRCELRLPVRCDGELAVRTEVVQGVQCVVVVEYDVDVLRVLADVDFLCGNRLHVTGQQVHVREVVGVRPALDGADGTTAVDRSLLAVVEVGHGRGDARGAQSDDGDTCSCGEQYAVAHAEVLEAQAFDVQLGLFLVEVHSLYASLRSPFSLEWHFDILH
jgi:hypothetical protein